LEIPDCQIVIYKNHHFASAPKYRKCLAVFLSDSCVGEKPSVLLGTHGFRIFALEQKSSQINSYSELIRNPSHTRYQRKVRAALQDLP